MRKSRLSKVISSFITSADSSPTSISIEEESESNDNILIRRKPQRGTPSPPEQNVSPLKSSSAQTSPVLNQQASKKELELARRSKAKVYQPSIISTSTTSIPTITPATNISNSSPLLPMRRQSGFTPTSEITLPLRTTEFTPPEMTTSNKIHPRRLMNRSRSSPAILRKMDHAVNRIKQKLMLPN